MALTKENIKYGKSIQPVFQLSLRANNNNNLGLVSPVRSHNPDKIIINHSSYQLSDIEKTVLAKGLNFALPPKKLNYADYLTPYELLFRDIKELSVDDSILERVKVDMKKICLSSFENFKFKDELNITPDELKANKTSRQRQLRCYFE